MAKPTEEELLILNSIIYTNSFSGKQLPTGRNFSVYEWANAFDINSIDNENMPAEISKSEFENIVNTIKSNPAVYDKMNIRDIDNSQYANQDGSQRVTNATISYGKDTIVVYKGTAGDMEWRDNGEGAYSNVTDTKQQQKALSYFDYAIGEYGKGKIYVTGHSKGGNKAQYVTVHRGNQIEHTYSFDGQGFNKAFLAKYRGAINAHGNKITSISNEYDFVNILLYPIAGKRKYIKSTTTLGIMDGLAFPNSDSIGGFFLDSLKNMLMHKVGGWHSPYSMTTLDAKGNLVLNDVVPQSDLMRELQDLFAHYATYMEEADWRYLCYLIMTSMQSGDIAYGDDYSEMPEGFMSRLTDLTKGYLEKTKGISGFEIFDYIKDLFGFKGIKLFLPGAIAGIGYSTLYGEEYALFPRDFTKATKDKLLSILKEVEDEPFWAVNEWAMFKHVSHFFGNISFPSNKEDLGAYYNNMIDKDNVSAKDINEIFEAVYAAEADYTKELEDILDKVNELNKSLTIINDGFKI